MNAIIKQLAEQAGMNIKTNVIGTALVFGTFEGYKTSHITIKELEKFAELIVRECLKDIETAAYHDSCEDWEYGYNAGLNKAKQIIGNYFEVEE